MNQAGSSVQPRWIVSVLLLAGLAAGTAVAQFTPAQDSLRKAIALYDDADFDGCIRLCNSALQYQLDYRDSTVAYFWLGFSHIKRGRTEVGIEYLMKNLRRDIDKPLPPNNDEFASDYAEAKRRVKAENRPEGNPRIDTGPRVGTTDRIDTVYIVRVETIPARPVPVLGKMGPLNYLSGAGAGALLGAASYLASVQFDNAADRSVKAHTLAGDSLTAADLREAALRDHKLGTAFRYAAFPLAAVGFYVGTVLSSRYLVYQDEWGGVGNTTQIYCSLDDNMTLSLGVRRSIW